MVFEPGAKFVIMPGMEAWEAFLEGGPRKRVGGGSLSLPLLVGTGDILFAFD